jgi:hypothetical protein
MSGKVGDPARVRRANGDARRILVIILTQGKLQILEKTVLVSCAGDGLADSSRVPSRVTKPRQLK